MILTISNSGEILPIVSRLKKEGVNIKTYIHTPAYRKNYSGILPPHLTLSRIKNAVKQADLVIFDINHANEGKKEDRALLKIFGCKVNSPGVFGPIADKIRQSTSCIGSSEVTEEWEMNRALGAKVAQQIGLNVPHEEKFTKLSDGVKFLKDKKDLWVFKPNDNKDLDLTYVEKYPGELVQKLTNEYMTRLTKDKFSFVLQNKVEGVEISTEGWFDGKKFSHLNHTIEEKRMMNSNLGISIGSQSNTVWVKQTPGILSKEFDRLIPKLKDAGYVGPIDINAIVQKDKIYFLEFSTRFGWDALYCLLSLLKSSLSDFFQKGKGVFSDGYASSERISIPPYPYNSSELLAEFAKDVTIQNAPSSFWMEDVYFDKGLRCAGTDGILGVMVGTGRSIGESVHNVYKNINKVKISSYLQYRTDLGRRAEKALQQLKKWGYKL